jgi:hypothetical protein
MSIPKQQYGPGELNLKMYIWETLQLSVDKYNEKDDVRTNDIIDIRNYVPLYPACPTYTTPPLSFN